MGATVSDQMSEAEVARDLLAVLAKMHSDDS